MANLVDKIIKLKAKEFNKKREILCPLDSYAWFLEKVGMTDTYVRTFILTDWYYKWNDYRYQMHIWVATKDSGFVTALYSATDISINGIVYSIDKRDIIPPDGKSPAYQLYVTTTVDTFTEADLP